MTDEVTTEAATEAGEESLGDAGKQALDRMKTERNSARNDLKAFTDLGLTPEQIRELQSRPGPTSEKDVEKLIAARVAEVEAAQTERSNAKARAAEVRAQAAELGFIKPAQALALIDARKLAEVGVNDDGDADPDAVKKLLEALKTDSPHLLKPTDTTADHRTAGIGASGSDARSDVRPGVDRLRSAYANTPK